MDVSCFSTIQISCGMAHNCRMIDRSHGMYSMWSVLHARVFLQMMTYRVGHHSTSDDSSRYRDVQEMALWRSQDPVDRLRIYLEEQGLWDAKKEAALRGEKRAECTDAIHTAGAMAKHPASEIFTDGA